MATYWVEAGHGGTDSGTETNPWLTISQAASAVAAGDHVWIKASADYTEAVVLATTGNSISPITYEGYTTTEGDGGKCTLDGGGTLTSGISGYQAAYSVFKNIIIDDYTGVGFNASTGDNTQLRNCEITNNGGHGVVGDNRMILVNCKINNNAGYGVDVDTYTLVLGCEVNNNGNFGLNLDVTTNIVFNCIVSGNAYRQISGDAVVLNSTIDGKNVASVIGIYFDNVEKAVINSIIYDCAYGINATGATYQSTSFGMNNLLYSNGTNYANWPEGSKDTDLTTDPPGFTDEAGGDYTLASTSAARNAGADASGTSSPGMDIGAHQSEDAGGGGSRVIITG